MRKAEQERGGTSPKSVMWYLTNGTDEGCNEMDLYFDKYLCYFTGGNKSLSVFPASSPVLVSGFCDKAVRVWHLDLKERFGREMWLRGYEDFAEFVKKE